MNNGEMFMAIVEALLKFLGGVLAFAGANLVLFMLILVGLIGPGASGWEGFGSDMTSGGHWVGWVMGLVMGLGMMGLGGWLVARPLDAEGESGSKGIKKTQLDEIV